MDRTGNISLFSDDGKTVAMPSIPSIAPEQSSQPALISKGIDDAISGEQVKTILLPEDNEIEAENYVIDLMDTESVSTMQLNSLKCLLSRYGDIAIYLYTRKSGLKYVGEGERYELERLVPLIKHYVFDDKISVYRDLQQGGKANKIESKDITKMRINL